jgi:hypothetical protein
MSVSSISSGDGSGFEARVDSRSRLQVLNGCPARTVYTTLATAATLPTVTTLPAREGRCSITIQNQGAFPLAARFEEANPGATDFQIAAGGSFTLSGYAGEVRVGGVGGGPAIAVLEVAE